MAQGHARSQHQWVFHSIRYFKNESELMSAMQVYHSSTAMRYWFSALGSAAVKGRYEKVAIDTVANQLSQLKAGTLSMTGALAVFSSWLRTIYPDQDELGLGSHPEDPKTRMSDSTPAAAGEMRLPIYHTAWKVVASRLLLAVNSWQQDNHATPVWVQVRVAGPVRP
jgi:hypothetical protein